jgi:hypothetical protein
MRSSVRSRLAPPIFSITCRLFLPRPIIEKRVLLDRELDREFSAPAWANTSKLFERLALRSGSDLSVNIHGGRDAGVPHLAVHRFRVGSRLHQPRSVGSAETAPVHERQTEFFRSRLNVAFEYVLVVHRAAGLHALENQIIRASRLDQLVGSRRTPCPNLHGKSLQAKHAVYYSRGDSDGRCTGLGLRARTSRPGCTVPRS